jgi:microcystin-dependent protein
MAQPFIGEIRMFAGNFAPAGWMFCEGQTIPISENDALFTLIGTTYGGDGQETFQLPNLQSRVPLHFGTGPDGTTYQQGEMSGVESVTVSQQQTPIHTHPFLGSSNGANTGNPANKVVAQAAGVTYMIIDGAEVAMNANAVSPVGGGQPHENCQPFLCINYIISLFGIFPSQT